MQPSPGDPSHGMLAPVRVPSRGRSGWAALALTLTALAVAIGVALVEPEPPGRGAAEPGIGAQARPSAGVPTETPPSVATATARPARTSSPTPAPEPFVEVPLLAVSVSLGPVLTCPPGSSPNEPGPPGQDRPPLSHVAPLAFDRDSARIVAVVGMDPSPPETWAFDVCTNRWTRMNPADGPIESGRRLVHDIASDLTIMFGGRIPWAYDLEADRWTEMGAPPVAPESQPRPVYDPVSEAVVVQAYDGSRAADWAGMWTYEVDTDGWSALGAPGIRAGGGGSPATLMAHDATVDRVVAFNASSGRTRLLDLRAGTWARSRSLNPDLNFGWFPSGGEITFDEALGQAVMFSDGRVAAYDGLVDQWRALADGTDPNLAFPFATGPTARLGHSTVYDPVNRRLVVYGGIQRTADPNLVWVQADDVLALDPSTGTWTTLLEASVRQPQR